MELKNKKVLIVGFGKSGQATLRYLLSQGARVAVTDLREEKSLTEILKSFQGLPIDWYLGKHPNEVFTSAQLIVASPGVPWNLEQFKEARAQKIPVISEMELFFLNPDFIVSQKDKKIIAVTGTNGKTTTVHLIDHLLKTAGKKSLLAGNVGTPLIDCLEEFKKNEFLVLEVSSYQLEATPSLKPQVAVWLNITEDHLDWHEGFDEYLKAKIKLIRQTGLQGMVVYNADDTAVAQSVESIPTERFAFSTKRQQKIGGWVEEGKLIIRHSLKEKPLVFDLGRAALKGIHNWENMLASLLAVVPYIKDSEILQKGLDSFAPLPHRMQVIREKEGVLYINDSKGTNVGAVVKAFASVQTPVVWIAGGRDKGGSLEPLKSWIKKKSKKIILLGEAKERMAEEFKDCGEVLVVNDLKEAVVSAAKIAKRGDTVLFSPACSSFDMFKDYAHRGEEFIRLVKEL